MGNKCLEFCQALANQGQKFSFSLTIGSNFMFSLDNKEKDTSLDTREKDSSLDISMVTTLQHSVKRKLSPSQLRRNMKRKQDFLNKKSENAMTVQSAKNKNLFLCNQCDHFFKSDNDLDNHMDTMHKVKIPSEHIEQLDGHKDDLKKCFTGNAIKTDATM